MDTVYKTAKDTKRSTVHPEPKTGAYFLARVLAFLMSRFVFRRKVLRNEIRSAKGAFVVLANHECAIDAGNLIDLCRRKMTFVVSNSFYWSLPFRKMFDGMGVIVKQQFQTEVSDLKKMKSVITDGRPLVLYPAGLMSENGLSTPIPEGTWSFLKWLDTDVYAARITGSYFIMPKWTKGIRPGRTTMDVYKLFDREELKTLSTEEIRAKVEDALLFDAYAEQESLKAEYRKGDCVEGLENVLYICPECRGRHTVFAENRTTLTCRACGFSMTADKYGFFHNEKAPDREIRHASDWSRQIDAILEDEIKEDFTLSFDCTVQLIDKEKHRFTDSGRATVTLDAHSTSLVGTLGDRKLEVRKNIAQYPLLPFSPNRYVEIQDGREVYRCCPDNGEIVMDYINALKLLHRRAMASDRKKTDGGT